MVSTQELREFCFSSLLESSQTTFQTTSACLDRWEKRKIKYRRDVTKTNCSRISWRILEGIWEPRYGTNDAPINQWLLIRKTDAIIPRSTQTAALLSKGPYVDSTSVAPQKPAVHPEAELCLSLFRETPKPAAHAEAELCFSGKIPQRTLAELSPWRKAAT